MLLFKKSANRQLIPATTQLNLGVSPTQYSTSISPQKHIETNKPFTSYDIIQRENEYHTPTHYKNPDISLTTKIFRAAKNLKKNVGKTLFPNEKSVKYVHLNLGTSPTLKNKDTFLQNNSILDKGKETFKYGGKIIKKSPKKLLKKSPKKLLKKSPKKSIKKSPKKLLKKSPKKLLKKSPKKSIKKSIKKSTKK
jgi:hypothetical protein